MSKTWKEPASTARGRDAKRGILLGQSGVYAVASRLCLLGHNVYFPAADDGVDLVLDNGVRLQVKVAHLTYPICGHRPEAGARGGSGLGNYLGGCYIFGLRRGSWCQEDGEYSKKYNRRYDEIADFFVLWGIDENRFWIVPTTVKNRNIYFGRKDHPNGSANRSYTEALKQRRIAEMEERWDLLDVNKALEQVASGGAPNSLKETV